MPRSRAALTGYPYGFLHHLRRVYARVQDDPEWLPQPAAPGKDPAKDPVVEDHMSLLASHLLCHSDCEGFYLPIEFRDVLFDLTKSKRIPGGMLGSSFRLRKELLDIAPKLGIIVENGNLSDLEVAKLNQEKQGQNPLWIERTVWLSLFEAARLSIEHRAAICFC